MQRHSLALLALLVVLLLCLHSAAAQSGNSTEPGCTLTLNSLNIDIRESGFHLEVFGDFKLDLPDPGTSALASSCHRLKSISTTVNATYEENDIPDDSAACSAVASAGLSDAPAYFASFSDIYVNEQIYLLGDDNKMRSANALMASTVEQCTGPGLSTLSSLLAQADSVDWTDLLFQCGPCKVSFYSPTAPGVLCLYGELRPDLIRIKNRDDNALLSDICPYLGCVCVPDGHELTCHGDPIQFGSKVMTAGVTSTLGWGDFFTVDGDGIETKRDPVWFGTTTAIRLMGEAYGKCLLRSLDITIDDLSDAAVGQAMDKLPDGDPLKNLWKAKGLFGIADVYTAFTVAGAIGACAQEVSPNFDRPEACDPNLVKKGLGFVYNP